MSEKPDTYTDTETGTDTVTVNKREKETSDTDLSSTHKGKDITEYTREEMEAAAVKELIKAYVEYFGDSDCAKRTVIDLVKEFGLFCAHECIHKAGKRAPSKRPKVPAEYIREMCRNGG